MSSLFFIDKRDRGEVIPLTDKRMTRFWITLEQSVDMVLHSFEIAGGGEILVPKIPSMKITDLAETIAPGFTTVEVGIRPGEKIHEVMITAEDSRHTIDIGEYYVICPEVCTYKGPQGEKVTEGFEYNSGTNKQYMTINDLREMPEGTGIQGVTEHMMHTPFLPYGRQIIDDEDIAAVVEALRSDWLTTGPLVNQFEEDLCQAVGVAHGVAVANGTAALHAAMHAVGVGLGDEVIVPPITFAATANCVVYQGGTPVFADVDAHTLLLDPQAVASAITPRTKGIIAVDYAGQPCDWDALRSIADRHGLFLVADACHALGATYQGRNVGTLADITVFSFHPVKHITTGEGGMCVTNDEQLARRMRTFRSHGITTTASQREASGGWFYEMVDLGYNYRITDIQCALGSAQLKKLHGWVDKRNALAQHYNSLFAGTGIKPLEQRP